MTAEVGRGAPAAGFGEPDRTPMLDIVFIAAGVAFFAAAAGYASLCERL